MSAKTSLVCVAHPDDETLFFGGLILSQPRKHWKVICMTDANADGEGKKRRKQFEKACAALGVANFEWWAYPDIYEQRLPVQDITNRLLAIEQPKEVYTHGPIGEYGHPHHQDVSCGVHRAFPQAVVPVYSVAYNSYPDVQIRLSEDQYRKKAEILAHVYGSETSRFLNLLPCTSTEAFHQLELAEVENIYEFFSMQKRLKPSLLNRYAWLADFLKQNRERVRPF